MTSPLSGNDPSAALRDFEKWAREADDPELSAYARVCADALIAQGVQIKEEGTSVRTLTNMTKFRGVYSLRRRFIARFGGGLNRKSKQFEKAIDAAKQYDQWCWEALRDPEKINFPEEINNWAQA